MSYKSVADVIAELIDNSIQAGASEIKVNIVEEEDGKRYVTLEDNGSWGSINKDTLIKCFGYGKNSTTAKVGLNEHNCGLKHSLAYMDSSNSRWKLQIKKNGVIWQLAAPYSHTMTFGVVQKYIGTMMCLNSTVIRVPLEDTQFKTLYYQRGSTGKPNSKTLTERLSLYLSATWMMNESIIKKDIKIYLNGKFVEPYDILRDKDVEVSGKGKIAPCKLKLSETSPPVDIEIWHLRLTTKYRKDHPLFRRSPDHAGAFIFKHGRYIKGQIFPEIYNKSRDYHYAGHLVLVNITGESSGLPSTHTTKNDFNNKDSKLDKLYEHIRETTPAIQSDEKQREASIGEMELIRRLAIQKTKMNERRIERNEYFLYHEQGFGLFKDGQKLVNLDRCDLVEYDKRDNTVTIIEGKQGPLTADHVRQLYFYYRNLKYFCPDFKDCNFELKFIVTDDTKKPAYLDELLMIQEVEPEFKVDVELFGDYSIL